MSAPLILAEGLVKSYRMGEGEVRALDGASLQVEAGEFVAVMGPSGSGKSTLLHILGLLDRPSSGTYRLDGADVSALPETGLARLRGRRIGFVFQFFNLLPRTSALRNVELPMVYQGLPAELRLSLASGALSRVGLAARRAHGPHQLSGGEQQRVAIARAVAHGPALLLADEPTGNLSTAQTREILDLLDEMNRTGITVLLVTHDPAVARHARRLVMMQDGRILSGGAPQRPPPAVLRAAPAEAPDGGTPLPRLYEGLRMAATSLLANGLRTALAGLGIVIGVASVSAMIAVGAGARRQAQERIAALGANLVMVLPEGRSALEGSSAQARLTLDDAAAIEALGDSAGVVRASPALSRTGVTVSHGDRNVKTLVLGTSPRYPELHNAAPDWGRFFTREEDLGMAKVCVLGPTAAARLFGRRDPVGETIKIQRVYFQVVGVLPAKGGSSLGDLDDRVLVPVRTAMKRLFGRDTLSYIEVQLSSPARTEAAAVRIRELLRTRHRVPDFKGEGFKLKSLTALQESFTGVARTLSLLLGAIAGISLVVGGIGIMNIMLVSVRERTREIGLRKAMGATPEDILFQFLAESIALCALGGAAGLLAGAAVSLLIARYAGWKLLLSGEAAALAFCFAAATGLIFGLAPAWQAAALPPVEALRSE